MRDLFLWVDLETTGLDPAKDVILEVAAVLTDDRLTELDALTATVDQSDWWKRLRAEGRRLPDAVREMHEASGLLGEALVPYSTAFPLHAIESDLTEWGEVHDHDRLILAGSSVHFDRGFIRRHMLSVELMLHYRHLDVSSAETLLGVADLEFDRGERPHRAEPDIRDTLDVARRIVKWADERAVDSFIEAVSR